MIICCDNCKFQVRAQFKSCWIFIIINPEHNYELSQDYHAHFIYQRANFIKANQETTANLYKSNAATQVVMSILREKYGRCFIIT